MARALPKDDSKVHDAKDFVYKSSDLQDHEAVAAVKIIRECQLRYLGRANTPENLEALRDEILTRLMEINILASFDPTPCFYGDPPEIEILGKVPTDSIHKDGFDHEKKSFEVNEAVKRNEEYRGQKERNKG